MEETRNGSHPDPESDIIMDYANKFFDRVNRHLEAERARGTVWETLVESVSSHASEPTRENVQHLISSVVFRCIKQDDEDEWELDDIWDNVDIRRLDDIQFAGNYVLHIDQPDDDGEDVDVRTAMIENPNVVLLRTTVDWSREDGNVWSQRVVWTGSFTECQRLVQLFDEANSNSPSSIQVRSEHFDLHLELRRQFIYLHHAHPMAATISAVESSPTVFISEEIVGTDNREGFICAICHEPLPIGEPAKQLPCNHIFHDYCLFQWFYRRLMCPLCRDEFDSSA
jgi:hypothetical protein